MKTRTPKPHGRLQDRPAKDCILLHLRAIGPIVVSELARKVCLTPTCTRAHLFDLMATGEAFKVEGTSPTKWSHEPYEAPAKEVEPAYADRAFVHSVRPAGTWTIDHAVQQASVFQLGGL